MVSMKFTINVSCKLNAHKEVYISCFIHVLSSIRNYTSMFHYESSPLLDVEVRHCSCTHAKSQNRDFFHTYNTIQQHTEDHSEESQWINRTSSLTNRLATVDTTNVIHALKLLACHNSG